MVDMDGNGIRFQFVINPVELFLQNRLRHDTALSPHQMFQNCAFAAGKLQQVATYSHVPPDCVEADVAGMQFQTEGAARTTQQRLYASNKLACCERLDEVIVCACVQSGHTIFNRVAGRQDQDGNAVVCSSHLREQFEPISVRQSQIENGSVVGGESKRLSRVRAQMHDVDDEAGSPQTGFQDLRDPRLVLDDQKAHGSHSPDWQYGRRSQESYLPERQPHHAREVYDSIKPTASLQPSTQANQCRSGKNSVRRRRAADGSTYGLVCVHCASQQLYVISTSSVFNSALNANRFVLFRELITKETAMNRIFVRLIAGTLMIAGAGFMMARAGPSSSVFIAGDRPVSAEEVEAKLKSDGWSNIVISSDGKYLRVSGLLNGKANNIAIDSQTGRLRAGDDDGDDD